MVAQMRIPDGLRLARFVQQLAGVDPQEIGNLFNRLQGEVALAAFHTAHIGPVHAHVIGEGFLTKPALKAIPAQIATDYALQLAFHNRERRCRPAT